MTPPALRHRHFTFFIDVIYAARYLRHYTITMASPMLPDFVEIFYSFMRCFFHAAMLFIRHLSSSRCACPDAHIAAEAHVFRRHCRHRHFEFSLLRLSHSLTRAHLQILMRHCLPLMICHDAITDIVIIETYAQHAHHGAQRKQAIDVDISRRRAIACWRRACYDYAGAHHVIGDIPSAHRKMPPAAAAMPRRVTPRAALPFAPSLSTPNIAACRHAGRVAFIADAATPLQILIRAIASIYAIIHATHLRRELHALRPSSSRHLN